MEQVDHSSFQYLWVHHLVHICRDYVNLAMRDLYSLRREIGEDFFETFWKFKQHNAEIQLIWSSFSREKDGKTWACAFDIQKLHPMIKVIYARRALIACISARTGVDEAAIVHHISSFYACWKEIGQQIVEVWKALGQAAPADKKLPRSNPIEGIVRKLFCVVISRPYHEEMLQSFHPGGGYHHPGRGDHPATTRGATKAREEPEEPKLVWEPNPSDGVDPKSRSPSAATKTKTKKSDVAELEKDLELKDEQIRLLEEEKEKFLQRIAQLMDDRISSDETDLENIAFTARPLRLAEEYQGICTKEWLEAKQELDNHLGKDQEKKKCKLLLELFMLCQKHVNGIHSEQAHQIMSSLNEPTQFWKRQQALALSQTNKTNSVHASHVDDTASASALPTELRLAVSKYSRHNPDKLASMIVAQDILQNNFVTEHLEPLGLGKKLSQGVLLTLTGSLVSILWKMVHQLPPMTFQQPQNFSLDHHELFYNSKPPPERAASKVSFYYIYPCLYHGDRLMVKGRVVIE